MVRQTPRMSARVVNAIRNLCDVHGSSSKQILNYIMAQDDIPTDFSSVQKQILGALKRGLAYGILKKNNGHYTLTTEPDIDKMETLFAPVEKRGRRRGRRKARRRRKSRSRRRGRSRRVRGKRRRRSRSRRGRRRRSRARRRRSRARRRASSPGVGKPRICEYCRSLAKKAQEDESNRSNSSQELLEEQNFQEHQQELDQTRRSKSRQRNRTRSRSVVNKDADGDGCLDE